MDTKSVILTFDLDWCSDEVLDYLLDKLIKYQVPATFFVTHYTKLLNDIRRYDFFELGIHPNFNKNSSHGNSHKEVVEYCINIVPEAISSRSHCLNVCTNKLLTLMDYGIKIDSSIIMPYSNLLINFYFQKDDKTILRVPFNWEDDYEFFQKNKNFNFNGIKNLNDKILNFHPIHVFLNSSSSENYTNYKNTGVVYKNTLSSGSETMLMEIIAKYHNHELNIYNLKQYYISDNI